MNVLMLGPESPGARFNDLDYARCLELYGAATVHRLDPDALYQERGMRGLEQTLLELIDRHGIEVIFYGLGMEFDFRPQFLHDDLAYVYRVLILGDDELYFDVSHRYYAQCFDLVLTNNPLVERFHLYGMDALFLPNVFHTELFCPAREPTKTIDVSFVGAMQGQIGREAYRQALALADVDLYLRGPGTAGGPIPQAEVIETYRRSRVNLNFTGVVPVTPLTAGQRITRRVRQVKGRCTKAALCGSFVLSEYAPGIERLFAIGSEIDVFHDEKELVEKVRYYLKHEDQREQMARRAFERARRQYDEAAFWPPLIDAVRQRMGRRKRRTSVRLDRPFLKAFGAWRFRYLVFFFLAGRWRLLWRELREMHAHKYIDFRIAAWFAYYGLAEASRHGSPTANALFSLARRLSFS